jgi:uncharacterized repeat protein (TIGR03837 family)
VDNYGDIGVVYRLAKALCDLDSSLSIRIVCDRLEAFAALAPGLDPNLAYQLYRGWIVVDWNRPWEGFSREAPRFVVESFACGRPEWYDALLFDPADGAERRVVNLEYLSAEDYSEEMHLMVSLTHSPLVRKRFFMPGFGAGTGGLIIDARFRADAERYRLEPGRGAAKRGLAARLGLAPAEAERAWVSVFSYERDYGRTVAELAARASTGGLFVLVAAGRSQAPFLAAWEAAGRPFALRALGFLPQETWDEVLLASEFAIVRGEESLARASLSGRPFVWHAYLQEASHQLVKVEALLGRMEPFFGPEAFAPVKTAFLALNERVEDGPGTRDDLRIAPFLLNDEGIAEGFRGFSASLWKHGDLAAALLTFFRVFV